MKKLFYIQNKSFVGNCHLWWRSGGCGYTYNLNEALKATEEEAKEICSSRDTGEDIPWSVEAVDSLAQRHLTDGALRLLKKGKKKGKKKAK